MYENMLTTYDKQFVFKCYINTKDTEQLKINSRFLKDVLYAWSCVNFKEEEIMWNNANIKINNKPFILCDWVEKGIIFIYDYRKKFFL